MPVYDYKCNECDSKYDIFHKSKENQEDIICPKCGSKNASKLMSAPSISMHSLGSPEMPACPSGGCCSGGSCGLN